MADIFSQTVKAAAKAQLAIVRSAGDSLSTSAQLPSTVPAIAGQGPSIPAVASQDVAGAVANILGQIDLVKAKGKLLEEVAKLRLKGIKLAADNKLMADSKKIVSTGKVHIYCLDPDKVTRSGMALAAKLGLRNYSVNCETDGYTGHRCMYTYGDVWYKVTGQADRVAQFECWMAYWTMTTWGWMSFPHEDPVNQLPPL